MISKNGITFKEVSIPVITFLVFLASWQLVINLFGVSKLILPSPSAVAKAISVNSGQLFINGLITLYVAVVGFFVGGISAFVMSILFHFSKSAERALYPYAIAFRAVPLIALAPLVVIWLDTGYYSKIALAAIISFFPILVNINKGFNSVDPDAIDMLTMFSASKWDIFKKVRLPSSLPYLFAGMKVSSSFAIIGAIVAEFTGAQGGIGFVIKSSSYYNDTDITFAAILVASAIGLMFFGAVVLLERRVVFYESHDI